MKCLIVLSGGMDSATALALMVKLHGKKNVHTITFNYGSKHNNAENKAAKKLARHYGVSNVVVKMPFVNHLFKSDLLKSGGKIPKGHYADPSMKRTVVPFRNTIMLSIAAGYAESMNCKSLVLGNHAGDHAIYPDCREEFTHAMALVLHLGGYKKLKLVTPFTNLTKTNLCSLGADMKVPYHLTYSCYEGKAIHCGQCGTCFERKECFREARVIDPTKYKDESGAYRG